MTHPGGYSTSWGGGKPPFDAPANAALHAARTSMGIVPQRLPLTAQDRAEAAKIPDAGVCRLCLGIHKFPNSPGCPRVATFKVDGDGRMTEGTFWPWPELNWAEGRVLFAADAHEEDAPDEGGA